MESLLLFSHQNPQVKIEWTHIGDGEQWSILNSEKANAPENCKINFLGAKSNNDVHAYYASNPVDLFVNLSTQEGTPVSIMEAISYGVPILATAVGGNKEVIDHGAGVLLSENPKADEIVSKILGLIENKDYIALRKDSYKVWNSYYNSERNYIGFSQTLSELLD
jgi:glycosyltransferase involved in cell wall biosynthesis